MKRSFAVTIAGQPYTIKSDADEAYVHALAGVVDNKIRQTQRGMKVTTTAAAVLAAMQLADDLALERARRAALRQRIREESRRLRDLLPAVHAE